MRWYAKLSSTLSSHEFFPLRNDCCVCARFRPLGRQERGYTIDAKKTIISLTIAHVDDILFAGLPGDLDALKTCLRAFIHGTWEHLSDECALVFCGVSLTLFPQRRLELSQQEYYPKITPLVKSEL